MSEPTPIISPEQADQIRKARVGAVLKKLREGKSITAVEQKLIEENTEKPAPKPEKGRPRQHAQTLPVYDSMHSCSAATNIPLTVLKRLKKSGCPAFRATRVYLGELLQWLFNQGEDSEGGNWAEALLEAKAKRERLKLENEKGILIRRDLVVAAFGRIASRIASIRTTSESQDPPRIVGKDLHEVRAEVRKIWDAVGVCLASCSEEFKESKHARTNDGTGLGSDRDGSQRPKRGRPKKQREGGVHAGGADVGNADGSDA